MVCPFHLFQLQWRHSLHRINSDFSSKKLLYLLLQRFLLRLFLLSVVGTIYHRRPKLTITVERENGIREWGKTRMQNKEACVFNVQWTATGWE